jgi:hypothetical protein
MVRTTYPLSVVTVCVTFVHRRDDEVGALPVRINHVQNDSDIWEGK